MYVIDSSALFNLRYYPKNVGMFAPIWRHLSQLARDGVLIAPREVLDEINYGIDGDPVKVWAASHDVMFIEMDDEQGAIVRDILARLKMNDHKSKSPHRADKWCVALAVVMDRKGHGVTVITEEGERPTRIPAMCRQFGIKPISLVKFFKREGL